MTVKPFAEQGHFTPIHDAVFDVLMPICPPNAFKILLFVLRKTKGWGKREDRLTYEQIMSGTGIKSDRTLSKELEWLTTNKLLLRRDEHGRIAKRRGARSGVFFALNQKFKLTVPSSEASSDAIAENAVDEKDTPTAENAVSATAENADTNKQSTNNVEGSLHSPSTAPTETGRSPKPKNGITKLMDRVIAAKERGANVTPLPDRDRRSIGGYYKQSILDDHLPEHCDYALDYMVAKASGEIENEPKAWCGFGTALDRVELEGWRPDHVRRRLSEEEEAKRRAIEEEHRKEMERQRQERNNEAVRKLEEWKAENR